MIADLKPYPEYRTPEGSWLGQVPSHWSVRRFKYLLRETDSRSTSGKEQLLRVSQYTGVTQRRRADGGDEPDTRAESLVGYKRVETSQLVVNIMLAWNGSLGVSNYAGIASPAYCVYHFNDEAQPWYYHHLLRSPVYKTRIKTLSTGVVESRLRLYTDSFYGIEGLLPPPSEQAAIVRFLDWANGRLERAIRAKRKVIALLHEQKQAIIHKAVTQGLDPNVPKRDSGIPWLGEIPSHWEVRKLRFLFRYCKGSRAAEITNEYIGRNLGDFPVFSGQTENGGVMGRINWHEFTFDSPVVFVSTVGARAMSTRTVQGRFSLSQNCALIIPRSSAISVTFFEKVFQRLFAYEKASISLVMQPSLRFADLNRFFVPLPPHSEQVLITNVLSERLGNLDSVMERLQREITLLREYRTRLVADVVTGKLDVREAALLLPEEDVVLAAEDVVDEAEDPELEEVEG
jgi:type I restriction enzyme S subunit